MIKRAMNPEHRGRTAENSDTPKAEDDAPKTATEPTFESMAPETVEPTEEQPAAEPIPEIIIATPQSRTRTADQLQSLILDALSRIPDAPKHGMAITVYGYHPWNAMVSFAPGSTRTSTAAIIRSALIKVVDEMRGHFDIEMPRD